MVKPQPEWVKLDASGDTSLTVAKVGRSVGMASRLCRFGQPGDRLWGRETWDYHVHALDELNEKDGPFVYRADPFSHQDRISSRWRSPIHMPRWASRITLDVVAVRVERLQEISEEGAMAEGVELGGPIGHLPTYLSGPYAYSYAQRWESIHGPGSWDANPWLWVIEFKRIEGDNPKLNKGDN